MVASQRMFDCHRHSISSCARVAERNSRRGSLSLAMPFLQKLSVRDAQTKLLCAERMHPCCVHPTTGTILFIFYEGGQRKKRGGVAAHVVELDTHNKGEQKIQKPQSRHDLRRVGPNVSGLNQK